MKCKMLFLSVLMMCVCLNVHSQKDSADSMVKLLGNCRRIVILQTANDTLQTQLSRTTRELEEKNKEWQETCDRYMTSKEQTAEGFNYLIQHTDSVQEKDLYNSLVDAARNVKTTDSVIDNGEEDELTEHHDSDSESENEIKEKGSGGNKKNGRSSNDLLNENSKKK